MPEFTVIKSEESRTADRKVRLHRIGIIARIVAVAVLVLGALFFIRHFFDTQVYTGYEILSKSLRSDSDTAQYMSYNGHILKYSQDGAEAFDGTKDMLWNVTYEMQNPQVATCGDYVALGDQGSTEILVVDPKGAQTEIRTKLPVLNFCVAGQGVVAAVLEDGTTSRINIYDKEGTVLAGIKSTMGKSGYPMDITLSPNGTLLGVAYVRMNQNQLYSSVAFYNFGGVGRNEIDNYVSGYDYDGTVIPRIRFLNDRAAVAIGDDRMVFYNGAQKPEAISENRIDREIQSVFYGNGEVALVFRSGQGGDSSEIELYNDRGKLEFSKEFDLKYTDVQLANGLIIIYNDAFCQIFNRRGLSKFDGVFEDSTLLMVPTKSPTRYTLVNRNTTQSIRLD